MTTNVSVSHTPVLRFGCACKNVERVLSVCFGRGVPDQRPGEKSYQIQVDKVQTYLANVFGHLLDAQRTLAHVVQKSREVRVDEVRDVVGHFGVARRSDCDTRKKLAVVIPQPPRSSHVHPIKQTWVK